MKKIAMKMKNSMQIKFLLQFLLLNKLQIQLKTNNILFQTRALSVFNATDVLFQKETQAVMGDSFVVKAACWVTWS